MCNNEKKNTEYIIYNIYKILLENIDNNTNSIILDVFYNIDVERRLITIKNIEIEKFVIYDNMLDLISSKIDFKKSYYFNKPIDICKLHVGLYNENSTDYEEGHLTISYGEKDLPKVKRFLS